MADMTNTVELAKDQILDDISKGLVPASIKSFSELHNYVDANEYGDLVDLYESGGHFASYDRWIDYCNEAQSQLDTWIKTQLKEEENNDCQ